MYAQQVQRPNGVVLLSRGAGLVAHEVGDDAGRNPQPLRQRLERAPQTVQRQPFDARHRTGAVVRLVREAHGLGLYALYGRGAGEHPFVRTK